METKKFIYYQEEEMFVGWLEEFPDYRSQGETLDELEENLRDIYNDCASGRIPFCADSTSGLHPVRPEVHLL